MIGQEQSGRVPAILVCQPAVDQRPDDPPGQHRAGGRGGGEQGHVKPDGNRLAQTPIDLLQVLSELPVPHVVELRVVMIAEPPEPVASLGGQNMVPRGFGASLEAGPYRGAAA